MSIHTSVESMSDQAQPIDATSDHIVSTELGAAVEVDAHEATSQEVVTTDDVVAETAPAASAPSTTASAAATAVTGNSTGKSKHKKNRKNKQQPQQSAQPQSATEQPKPAKKHHTHAPVLVNSGEEHIGRVTGFALADDKETRTGVVLRFKGGDSAFMHSSQVGGHFPESRLKSFMMGDMVRVIVTVKPGEGKRRVKASERTLFLADIAKQLEGGLAGVTGEVTKKLNIGALVKITTPGPAIGFVGLLHFASIPGGQRALEQIVVGKSITVDIVRSRVDEEKCLLKMTLDAFGEQRREIERRFPGGSSVSGNIVKDAGEGFVLKLKSGDFCLLPKTALNGADPDSLKVGRSTSAFVTGVDPRGTILLSKVMPE